MRIETVGIVGAGTMGGGIAINLAQHGFRSWCTMHGRRRRGRRSLRPPAFYAGRSRRAG